MIQAASVEDSLSNLEGTEDFQNSKTKQTSTEDKKNENADRNSSRTEIHHSRPTLNQQYFTDVKQHFGKHIIRKVFQIKKINVLEIQQHSQQALDSMPMDAETTHFVHKLRLGAGVLQRYIMQNLVT
jgi:hypothetical protein